MIYRHATIGFVAAALVVASVTGIVAPFDHNGDVNGDAKPDILDIQIVAATLLHGPATIAGADINHDGRVDILDFQRVVTQASLPAPAPLRPRNDKSPVVLDLPRQADALSGADFRPLPAALLESPPLCAASQPHFSPESQTYFREIRHALGYSSHSPPIGA